jgi:hypothetical protein
MAMSIRADQKAPGNRDTARRCGQVRDPADANDKPDIASHPRMLGGISDAEDAYLQRRANAVARRVFRRRIKDPARTASDLRAALREEGLIRIRMTRLTCSSLWFEAEAGRKLKPVLREIKARSADDIYYDCFTRAARKIGLKPGIEDVYAHVKGQKVEGTVDTVPFAVTSAAVTRMVDDWLDQG